MSEDREIIDSIERWAERELRPIARKYDHADEYPTEIVEQMKELGLFGAIIEPEYGGLGLSATTYARLVTVISSIWMAPVGIFNSHLIMAACVQRHGTPEQKQKWLPRFASGELRGGIGLTEPNAGTDLQSIRSVARRDGDHYVINGTKTWITNGVYGTCFGILVKTNPDAQPRHSGMSMFICEKGAGFKAAKKIKKLGYKSIDSAELVFEDYRVPADQLVGGVEGHGFKHAVGGLELGRINVAARGAGIAAGALRDALRYAQERQTFGKPIAQHQAIQLKLADMATRVEAARAADRTGSPQVRHRRALRSRGRHGQAVRVRGGRREQPRGDADLRRLQLLDRFRRRALLPRRAADVHRRRHERNAAHHHRAPTGRTEPDLMNAPFLPLRGLRVLTFENFGAGPFGSMYLADLGADVVKIENREQGGDATRGMGPHFLGEHDSHFFQTFNLNKRSVTLNLKTEAGQQAFRRLVARSRMRC
jgi:alkylation response protein AidB-like acyl-CoA dehydrogenase